MSTDAVVTAPLTLRDHVTAPRRMEHDLDAPHFAVFLETDDRVDRSR